MPAVEKPNRNRALSLVVSNHEVQAGVPLNAAKATNTVLIDQFSLGKYFLVGLLLHVAVIGLLLYQPEWHVHLDSGASDQGEVDQQWTVISVAVVAEEQVMEERVEEREVIEAVIEQPVVEEPKPAKVPEKVIEKNLKQELTPKPVVIPRQIDNLVPAKTDTAPAESELVAPVLVEKANFAVKPRQPSYPGSAKRRGQQGTVTLEIWIDNSGDISQVLVLESSGFPLLDNAAIEAAHKWQFKPHKVNGEALASRVLVPIKFQLK